MNPQVHPPRQKLQAFRKLPCGGHVTQTGKGDQIFRIVRELGGDKPLVFVLLHPPAKGHDDVEPCVKYARAHGFGHLVVLYLFPYRAADMSGIRKQGIPWGETINRRLQEGEIRSAINLGGKVIAAWGHDGSYQEADQIFMRRYDGTPRDFSPYPAEVLSIEFMPALEAAA